MTTTPLYALADAREVLDRIVDDAEGELTPEIEAALDALDGAVTEKIERVALYIRERSARGKAVKEERDRLDAIVKREERTADSLKAYLMRNMERIGKTKVDGLLAAVAIQANPFSVKTVLDSDTLKTHFGEWPFVVEVPASYRIDRDQVLALHKVGESLPDGIVVERGSHIRIR